MDISAQQLKPIPTSKKVEHVLSALYDYIIENNVKPGTELPPETIMAQQLGVSKMSIREALRVAESQGLIEIAQGRRTKVADISLKPATGIINLILRRSNHALLELTEARQCLECAIVRFAALRAQTKHVKEMRKTIVELEQNRSDLEYCVNLDLKFHNIMVKATGNPVFEIMLDPLAEFLKESRLQTMLVSGVSKAIEEHRAILNAITEKNPDKAEHCMKRHLQTAERNLREQIENTEE